MSSNKKPVKLNTARRKKLVEELANPQNKSIAEAGRKAGFAENTIRGTLYHIAQSPAISKAVQKRRARAAAHHQVTAEEVLGHAVFNMRGSIDDLIDSEGRFDLKKARRTGAIDLIKEFEVTETIDPVTKETTVRHKLKLESPAAARKEVANYIGLERFGDGAATLEADFRRICSRITEESIVQQVSEREMAEFFLSDERVGRLDPQVVERVKKEFIK